MAQKTYKLLGYPLAHSLSPFIHERLFQLSKKNSIYDLYEISQQNFEQNVESLLKNDGLNITIPYKVAIIKHLDKIDERAKLYNSVNTVHCGEKETVGYNTDCYGFLQGIKDLGTSLDAGPVLLLGAGGAANMIATEVALTGSRLTIAVRESGLPRAEALRNQLMTVNAACYVNVTTLDQIEGSYNLLVNATPVGMYPHMNECPVSKEVISSVKYVYDLIYNPVETKLIQMARELSIPAANGISMLVWQAVYAHKIWYQADFKKEDIDKLIRDTEENIVNHFVQKLSDRDTQKS